MKFVAARWRWLILGALLVQGCGRSQEVLQPVALSERDLLDKSCADEHSKLRSITSFRGADWQLFTVKKNACPGKRSSGMSLAEPVYSAKGAFRGVAVVDGVFGAKNPEISQDITMTKAIYEKTGWYVIDTSNKSPAEIRSTMEAAREDQPSLFTSDKPMQIVQIAHGSKAGKDQLILESLDPSANGGIARFSAEERVGNVLKGAGDQAQANLFVSSCYSGNFCPEKTGAESQLNTVVTSSAADQVSFAGAGGEHFLRALNGAQLNPGSRDRNGDGLVTLTEAIDGKVEGGSIQVDSVYGKDGEWHHESPLGTGAGTKYPLPDSAGRTTAYQSGVIHEADGRYTASQTFDFPQTPEVVVGDSDPIVATVPREEPAAEMEPNYDDVPIVQPSFEGDVQPTESAEVLALFDR